MRLVEQLKTRMVSIAEQSSEARTRPRAAIIEWIDPLMAGGENLFGVAGQPSPRLDWNQVVVADPDVVLVHPCGFEMARTLEEMPLLEHCPGWRELKDVQNGRILSPTAISISTARGLASSKVWKFWPRSFNPNYSLPATKEKVGCTT